MREKLALVLEWKNWLNNFGALFRDEVSLRTQLGKNLKSSKESAPVVLFPFFPFETGRKKEESRVFVSDSLQHFKTTHAR